MLHRNLNTLTAITVRGRYVAASLAAAATALVVSPVAHAITWSPATTVSASGSQAYIGPRAATDANGDMMVAWLKVSSVSLGSWHCPCVVQAAYRPAGGSFGAPVNVSASMPSDDSAQQIALAMSASGDAIVGWNGGADPSNPGNYDMPYAAIRPAGASSSFGQPVQLATPVGNNEFGTALEGLQIDAAGDAIAMLDSNQAYTGSGGITGDQVIDTALVRRPAGGQFDTAHPQVIGDGTHNTFARALAMSSNGKAVLAMRVDGVDESHPTGTVTDALEVTTSSGPGAPFTTPATTIESLSGHPQSGISVYPLIDTGSFGAQDIAIDDAGDYVVGYTRSEAILGQPNQSNNTVKASIDGAAGVAISPPADTFAANGPIVIDSTGQTVMLWSDGNTTEMESVRPAGGSFAAGVPTGLPVASAMVNAAGQSGANGQILYAFDAAGPNQNDVDASIGSAAGSFPAASTLASGDDTLGFGTGAAIDKNGNAVVAWLGGTTNQYEVHVAVTSTPGGGNPGGGNPGGGNPGGGNPGGGSKNPPNTVITKKKVNAHKHSVQFTFKATGASATGFDCALVKAPKHKSKKRAKPAYKSCKSPKSYEHLAHGHYTFYVRARNAAGPDKTPATATVRL